MKSILRVLAASLVLVAALTFVPALVGPADGGDTPYLSALSDLGVSAALAAPGCQNKFCGPGLKGQRRCKHGDSGTNCSIDSAGRCSETPC